MNLHSISYYDHVTLRPLNVLGALHEPDITIQVVPGHEADAEHGRISAEAPLGRAVLRKRTGDAVTIQVQDQSISMRILDVQRPDPSEDATTKLLAA